MNIEKIKENLKKVNPWERLKTDIPGIFIIKTPNMGRNIIIEVNPEEYGSPIKMRGLFLHNKE